MEKGTHIQKGEKVFVFLNSLMHLVWRGSNLFLMSCKLEQGPVAEVSGKENLMPEDGIGSFCR